MLIDDEVKFYCMTVKQTNMLKVRLMERVIRFRYACLWV